MMIARKSLSGDAVLRLYLKMPLRAWTRNEEDVSIFTCLDGSSHSLIIHFAIQAPWSRNAHSCSVRSQHCSVLMESVMIYLAVARFLSQRRRKEVCQVRKTLFEKPQLHD